MREAVDGMRRDLAGAPEVQERLREQVEQTRSKVTALETALSEERGLPGWVGRGGDARRGTRSGA